MGHVGWTFMSTDSGFDQLLSVDINVHPTEALNEFI
jgi:hypothetical protein